MSDEQEEQVPVIDLDDCDYYAVNNVNLVPDDGKVFLKAPIENFQVMNKDGASDHKIVGAMSLLKAMLKDVFSPHDLDHEDFFIHIEIHKSKLKEEYQAIVDEAGRPAKVKLEEDEDVNPNDPQHFQPQIKINDEELREQLDDELVEKSEHLNQELDSDEEE